MEPKDTINYPVLVLHKGHVAFRAKNTQCYGEDIKYPDGTHPQPAYQIRCGTCGAAISVLSVIAGEWAVGNLL